MPPPMPLPSSSRPPTGQQWASPQPTPTKEKASEPSAVGSIGGRRGCTPLFEEEAELVYSVPDKVARPRLDPWGRGPYSKASTLSFLPWSPCRVLTRIPAKGR